MRPNLHAGILLAALAMLAGCTTTELKTPKAEAKAESPEESAPAADAKIVPASAADEEACRTAVAKTTGSSDMEILVSDASEANPVIVVGVGPEKSRWQCLMAGGKVAGVMAVTAEVEF